MGLKPSNKIPGTRTPDLQPSSLPRPNRNNSEFHLAAETLVRCEPELCNQRTSRIEHNSSWRWKASKQKSGNTNNCLMSSLVSVTITNTFYRDCLTVPRFIVSPYPDISWHVLAYRLNQSHTVSPSLTQYIHIYIYIYTYICIHLCS